MEEVMYHKIIDKDYLGIATFLDYEVSVRECLADLLIDVTGQPKRKIIVDLALTTGLTKYRFVSYSVNDSGKILWNSSAYIYPDERIVHLANSFIKQNRSILLNSMLPQVAKEEFLNS